MVDRARQPWIVSRKLGFHGKLSGVPGVGIDFHSGDRLSIAWSRSWNYLPTVRPITTALCSFHFLFLHPRPPICFPVLLLFFFVFFSFLLFCWPVCREKSAPDLSFCAASENGVRLRGLRERSWISTRHVPVFSLQPLSFFLSRLDPLD